MIITKELIEILEAAERRLDETGVDEDFVPVTKEDYIDIIISFLLSIDYKKISPQALEFVRLLSNGLQLKIDKNLDSELIEAQLKQLSLAELLRYYKQIDGE